MGDWLLLGWPKLKVLLRVMGCSLLKKSKMPWFMANYNCSWFICAPFFTFISLNFYRPWMKGDFAASEGSGSEAIRVENTGF